MINFRTPLFNDMHVHFRQGDMLPIARYSQEYCHHALAMPNTVPPLTSAEAVDLYLKQIGEAINKHSAYIPMRSLGAVYLTEHTLPAAIAEIKKFPQVVACKAYPRAATTNSDHGIVDYVKLYPVFEAMQEHDIVLCLHGEHPQPHVWSTSMDWETEFVNGIAAPLIRTFPKLRVVLEHVTTEDTVHFVKSQSMNVAATITVHHVFLTLDDIVAGKDAGGRRGLMPDNFCKPIAKKPRDRMALQRMVYSGDMQFMLGTDSAPHDVSKKYSHCCAAGCFTAQSAPELLAEFFMEHKGFGAYQHEYVEYVVPAMRRFVSENAQRFYGLPSPPRELCFARRGVPRRLPESVIVNNHVIPTFMANMPVNWDFWVE